MWGIDLLTLQTLTVLAAAGSPAGGCAMPEPTKINVVPRSAETGYDNSLSTAEMQKIQSDTVDPYGFHAGVSEVQGFMKSGVAVKYEASIDYVTDPNTKTSCVWYSQIDVNFSVAPVIYLAREVYADPCKRKAVSDHELKHVKTERVVVNKYAQAMGQKIYDELMARGFSAGPIPESQREAVIDRMHKTITQVVELEKQKMDIERLEAQRAIDSLEEYKRVTALCPQNTGAPSKR